MMLAGFYEKEITPALGWHMPGSFEVRKAVGVQERLMVKGAAFELNNKRVIVLSIDMLFTPQKSYDKAIKKIYEYTGIEESDVLIQATHTHTGAAIIPAQEGALPADESYIEALGDMIADCGILAFHRMIPVTAKFAKTKVEGITFIRNYKMKDGNIRTNPRPNDENVVEPFGTPDEEFSVLYFFDEAGAPAGSITNFACHHCCCDLLEYCADYSAVMAHEFKKKFGVDYVNVMLSGACGNLNHFDFFSKDQWRKHKLTPRYVQMGKILAEEAFKLYEIAKPIELNALAAEKEKFEVKRRKVSDKLVKEAKELYAKIPFDEILDLGNISLTETEAYKRAIALRIIEMSEMPEKLPVCVQAIKLGECMIYGFSGEIYNEFGVTTKEKSPAKYNMFASIANATFYGYIPTKEAFNTTIYEAQLPSAKSESEAGYLMVDKAIELAKKIY